jgi:hypothetical protein
MIAVAGAAERTTRRPSPIRHSRSLRKPTCQLIGLAHRANTLRQLHKESAMPHEPRYGVKFVGYSANVIARKNGRDVEYARLDFVSGAAFMRADGGWVTVPKPIDLKPFLKASQNRERASRGSPAPTQWRIITASHWRARARSCRRYAQRVLWSKHCLGSPRYGDQSLYPTTNQAIHRDRASTRTR